MYRKIRCDVHERKILVIFRVTKHRQSRRMEKTNAGPSCWATCCLNKNMNVLLVLRLLAAGARGKRPMLHCCCLFCPV